jgi:hypothetical protein
LLAGRTTLAQLNDQFFPIAFIPGASGAYLANATATFFANGPATVECHLEDASGTFLDTESSSASGSGDIFLGLTGATPASEAVLVYCASIGSSSVVTTEDVSLTAEPVTAVTVVP